MLSNLILGRNLTYNLHSYLKQRKGKNKNPSLDTFKEREKTKFILKAYSEGQNRQNKKYKKMHEENKLFADSYKLFDEIRIKKKYNEVTFKELIAEYKQKNYKIPDLSTKHNLFEESPLLLGKSKIIDYYKYHTYRDNININSPNVKLNQSEKSKKYLDKLEGVVRDHNLFHNKIKDTQYDYHMKIKTLLTEQDDIFEIEDNIPFKSSSYYKKEIKKLQDDIIDIKNGIERIEYEKTTNRSLSSRKVTMYNRTKFHNSSFRLRTIQKRQKTMSFKGLNNLLKKNDRINIDYFKNEDKKNENIRKKKVIQFQFSRNSDTKSNVTYHSNKSNNSENKIINSSNITNESNDEINKNNVFYSTYSTFQTTGQTFRNNSIKSRNNIINNLKKTITEKPKERRVSMTGLKLIKNEKKIKIDDPEYFNKYTKKSDFLEHFRKIPIKKINKKIIDKLIPSYCEKFLGYNEEKIYNIMNEEIRPKTLLKNIYDLDKIVNKRDFNEKIITTDKKTKKNISKIEKLDKKINKFDRELIKKVINIINNK